MSKRIGKLERTHGRASYANFIGIRRSVADSAAFMTLSQMARALYVDLRRQFNGHNNGDICAADSVLARYGWSHTSIHKGLQAIIRHGLMVKTRQGGIASMSRTCSLYAFTDEPIMANPGKGIAGAAPTNDYRDFKGEPARKRKRKKPEGSQHEREGTRDASMKVHGVNGWPPEVQAMDLENLKAARASSCFEGVAG